jgi:hypothetical protein
LRFALPPGADATQLRDYLLHRDSLPGVSGVYDYVRTPQRGLSIDDVVITRWDASADRWIVMSQPAGAPLAR